VSLDKTVVNEVYKVIVGRPGYLNQFPYIDCWQNAVLSWPIWLRPCLKEACRIIVARVATTSKCTGKIKEPILVEEAEEKSLSYCHFINLCHHYQVPYPHLLHWMGKLEEQSDL
jgi:hypothetical protein